ncbi:MAG: YjjG family noncanonical pyrimidine nucleotidase [Bacillota bacterium]
MKYKHLLFDLDGTLFDFQKSEEKALACVFNDYLLQYDNSVLDLYRAINHELWARLEKGEYDVDTVQVLRFETLFKRLEIEVSAECFNDEYLNRLIIYPYLNNGAFDVCKCCFHKGYKIHIVTNGKAEIQIGRCRASKICNLIANIFISDTIGYTKPNVKFFEHVLDNLDISSKDELLIIGDSLGSDVQGGENIGIDVCWYNVEGKNVGSFSPKYIIGSFSELKTIL